MTLKLFSKFLMPFLFGVACLGVAGQSKVPKTATENLQKASAIAIDAFSRNEYEKFADLVDPVTMRRVGGRTRIVEMMKQVSADSLKAFRTYRIVGGEPQAIVDAKTHLLAIVPMRIEGTTPKDNVIVVEDCFLGMSPDRGTTWRFANCSTFAEVHPRLKSKISIPKTKTSVDGVEQ